MKLPISNNIEGHDMLKFYEMRDDIAIANGGKYVIAVQIPQSYTIYEFVDKLNKSIYDVDRGKKFSIQMEGTQLGILRWTNRFGDVSWEDVIMQGEWLVWSSLDSSPDNLDVVSDVSFNRLFKPY
jgi:hypothetical protein